MTNFIFLTAFICATQIMTLVRSSVPKTFYVNPLLDFGRRKDAHIDLQPDDDGFEETFGILHTMENYTIFAAIEESIEEILTERLKLIQEESNLIKSFLDDYKESTGEAMKHLYTPKSLEERGRVVGSSYVLGHRMTIRYAGVTKKLRQLLNSSEYKMNQEKTQNILALNLRMDTSTENVTNSENLNGNFTNKSNETEEDLVNNKPAIPTVWPNWEDKYISLMSFFTLQEVNGMSPTILSKGLDVDTKAGGYLNAFHCAEIGMFALHKMGYHMAIEWFEIAMEMLVDESLNGRESISVDLLYSLLIMAIQENNRVFEHNMKAGKDEAEFSDVASLYSEPFTAAHLTTLKHNRWSNRQLWYFEQRKHDREAWSFAQHIDICIGIYRQTPEEQANLKCFYENKRHPYLYINPVKTEMLSENPPVTQFYELLGNSIIEQIKQEARPLLALSRLIGVQKNDWDEITKYRSSVSAYITPNQVPKVYKLAEMITGLSVIRSSEPTQIVEYTYGRHYTFHSDALESVDDHGIAEFGNRLATLLYYLEIPEMGGVTSFCKARLGAYQERGSAVLWYNLYKNGTVRQDVEHGACPVMYGHKIVANHWIRSHGNFKHHKCSLNQFE